uniref:phospholipase D n=1 Tax=Globisporangium ultimum (strain ATCC 200006 / CBS 805.95 / DAOM BR144) TaxID=431595 RepID=K3WNR4_GLOUD
MKVLRHSVVTGIAFMIAYVAHAAHAQPASRVQRQGVICKRLDPALTMDGKLCPCRPCHMCELNASQTSCGLVQTPGMDLSDGFDVLMEQPVTDLDLWFLTEDEITATRRGVPRDDLAVYSTGNKVSAYVAPEEFFNAAYKDIQATGPGVRIFLTSWTVDNTPLDPRNDANGEATGAKAVFTDAVARGVQFYALAHVNYWEKKGNLEVRDHINALPLSLNGGKARFLFDDRKASEGNSHHQKTLVIENEDSVVAYVGGIDLAAGRWDTLIHNQTSGWMDCHLRIAGPAAKDVSTNFLTRWNSETRPGAFMPGKLADFVNPEYWHLPAFPRPSPQQFGQHSVQIVRTYSPQYAKYECAPKGEQSLYEARIKAIRNAKNYIYIEDQYFVLVPRLLEELLNVLPGLQRLIVVVQRPGSDENYAPYKRLLHEMAAPMQKKFPNKFQLYSTKESRNIYIHTKLVLIDDVYVSIGSANWNDCSMFSDAELNANVVDRELVDSADGVLVTKLALDYRIRKFMELTGMSYEKLRAMKFIDAADQLDVAAKNPSTILDNLEPEKMNYKPVVVE